MNEKVETKKKRKNKLKRQVSLFTIILGVFFIGTMIIITVNSTKKTNALELDDEIVKEKISDEVANEEIFTLQADNVYLVSSYEDFKNAINDINNEGNNDTEYVISLNSDITISGTETGYGLYIKKKVAILGNGHTIGIDNAKSKNMIIADNGGVLSLGKQGEMEASKLTIFDTRNKQRDTAMLGVYSGSTLNVYDGVIIKDSNCIGSSMGSAILVNGGTLNMYGGEITQNSIQSYARLAGAVGVNSGTFNMYGGKIHNNISDIGAYHAYGGGVFVYDGTMNMYGGEISNNKSNGDSKTLYGGGIALYSSSNATSSKAIFGKDAIITKNTGTQGGGIFIQGDSKVIMEAGFKLTNNHAIWGGGLFHAGSSPLDIKKGVIIANNTADGYGADIYTSGKTTITLSDASDMNEKFTSDDSNRDITGWYYDYNPRWTFMDSDEVDITQPVNEKTGLIAAYEGLPKYRVTYEFVTGTVDKELPQEVTELLPIDANEYEQGTTVKAIQPDKTTIKVADGIWEFKGYEADEEVVTSDVKFIATWVFNPNSSSINAEDKILIVGDVFDSIKYVTAIDKEYNYLTDNIEILKNEVDTSKAGVYEVTYKVTNSKGASTVKTIKVTVKDKDKSENPETGDQTNLSMYLLMSLISVSSILTILVISNLNSNN